jgi:exodeoxyribonuclease-5
MIERFFVDKIKANFPFTLTHDQSIALEKIVDFIFSSDKDRAFLLKGYAGTGKSLLVGSLVKTMNEFNRRSVLLAPTGRAAKVFSGYAGQPAYTIHKKIYRQQKFSDGIGKFSPAENLHRQTLFIVDEASMISDNASDFSLFGSGRLLNDLIEFVYAGEGCRLMLLGDTAQLPPVKEEESPALNKRVLQSYGLEVTETTLTEIARQEKESGILYNATLLRDALKTGKTYDYPKLEVNRFSDVKTLTGAELIEEISDAYRRDGVDDTVVISRSNKRVNAYNNGIRNTILYREEELSNGDLLMITKNNYYWVNDFEDIGFLANGEFVEVVRIRGYEEMYGFRFCNSVLRHRDYDVEFEAKINLDVLHTEVPGLTREQNDELFSAVMEDYSNIPQKRKRYNKIKENPYFNALQVKYGYAVTCHKAQGGEWKNVFLDIGYVRSLQMDDNFYRWLYTSITRSAKMLYLINLPADFISLSK